MTAESKMTRALGCVVISVIILIGTAVALVMVVG
jgi:hypothetical protein